MAVNFKKIEKVVKKTISDLGEKHTVTLQQPSSSAFDQTKPYEGPADNPTDIVVEAVVTPFNKTARGVSHDQNSGDLTMYITGSALSVEPSVGWLCLLDSVKYKITDVGRTRPGVTTLLWTLVLER